MEKERFYQLLAENGKIQFSYEELNTLIKKYPWFELPKILLLLQLRENGKHEFHLNLKDFGIYFHDRKRLFEMLNTELRSDLIEKFNSQKKEETEISNSGIDKDLLEFSYNASREDEQKPPLQKQEAQSPSEKTIKLIDRFLVEEPGVIKADKKTSLSGDVSRQSTEESEHLLTDTLAKIYVKQGLYSKAIFAYEKLSLKYPEKSIYFASQIEEIKEITNKK